MSRSNSDEALQVIRQMIRANDDAMAAVMAIERLQDHAGELVEALRLDPGTWREISRSQAGARHSLQQARACLDQLVTSLGRSQSSTERAQTWADQLVDLNERLQSAVATMGQDANRVFELLRPGLVGYYLDHASRNPRWGESWPADAEAARRALERAASDLGAPLEALDIQLARLRWEVGWPQQRIARVVGLSQPSVATRLWRVEMLISLHIAMSHVRHQAQTEDLTVAGQHIVSGRLSRGPTAEVIIPLETASLHLDLLVASGESGSLRRGTLGDRGVPRDMLAYTMDAPGEPGGDARLRGVGIYFRDRGVMGYYSMDDVVGAIRQFRGLPTEAVLQRLRETTSPLQTLRELVARLAQLPQRRASRRPARQVSLEDDV